ncbi:hypothetical protein WOLCODRAFT_162284 [Wolfiporia cocos MD-104 SS10]|uniref:U6 snRNA phosphodiesterase 1 n=1 Tax=Wolfiporia cocos (strain MD-104) TaxID=742152 RepID=A0A2H3JDM8_WOLCO|nr:hypothetical protein WOLCODRAFT_162284 [Wolfiporia cocos MD-104 SS10]
MKRGNALVSYESSDEDESPKALQEIVSKKRKLPGLSSAFVPKTPVDNPSLHQGRIRTTPHVEGQYAAYVYVPLLLDDHPALHKLLLKAFTDAKLIVPPLHPIGLAVNANAEDNPSGRAKAVRELHVSITRPIYLRAHQRDELRHAVRAVSLSHSSFKASFAQISELTNDERTRTFLALEVGAGHAELKKLTTALTPTLTSLRQKDFYADPRFHASFAWALLDRPPLPAASALNPSPLPQSPKGAPQVAPSNSPPTTNVAAARDDLDSADNTAPQDPQRFLSIPCFPSDLVPSLNHTFGDTLVSRLIGSFEVTELRVRIGQEVNRFRLRE